MNVPKQFSGWFFLFIFILVTSISFPAVPAMGGEEQWDKVWSGKGPVPTWWDWGNEHEESKPVRGGVLQVAAATEIGVMNFNRWPIRDAISLTYMFELSAWYDGNFCPTVPWLVESWEYLDPQTVITKIRKGIQFHDGEVFNAQSLKSQIEYVQDKRNGCWTRAYVSQVESMEILDEYTLRWRFSKPWATFVANVLANNPTFMMSPQALRADYLVSDAKKIKRQLKRTRKKVGKLEKNAKKAEIKGEAALKKALTKLKKEKQNLIKLEKEATEIETKAKGLKTTDTNPVGTGQFMLEESKPGNYTKFKRNPNWWFAKAIGLPDMPYLDGIKTTVIPDLSIQVANLRAGKIHNIVIDPVSYGLIKDNKKLKIYSYPANNLWSLRINLAKGPCKDIRVRKAISHAIDREALVFGITHGYGEVASGPYPRIHWAHNPGLKPVKYDPALSKKLLAEAGYGDGLDIKGVMFNIDFSKNTGLAVKSMLAQVGINWEYSLVDTMAWTAEVKSLDYDLAGGGWFYILDPDLMATGLYHPKGGFNFGRSNNKKAVALIEAGRLEHDFNKRQKIYWDLEEALYNNYEDIWLWWPDVISVYNKEVVGFDLEMIVAGGSGYRMSHSLWFKTGKP